MRIESVFPRDFNRTEEAPHVWSRGIKRALEDVTVTPWGACLKMQSALGSSCCVLGMLIFHVCSSEKGVLWSLTICWNLQIIGFTSTWKAAILHDKNVRTIFRRIIDYRAWSYRAWWREGVFGGDGWALGQELQEWGVRTTWEVSPVNPHNPPSLSLQPENEARNGTTEMQKANEIVMFNTLF